jgi:outer membrane protein assembly factor BamB
VAGAAALVLAPVGAGSHGPGAAGAAATTATGKAPLTTDGGPTGTSWYPQAGISPAEVNRKDFGQLFDVTLPPVRGVPAGQIYAQPLVADGVLFVVTENDNAYGLDPVTGAVRWSRNFGTPFSAASIDCGDLYPNVGITSTPVIDRTRGIAYFVSDTQPAGGSQPAAAYRMQAVALATGAEEPSFPVAIAGDATNTAGRAFDPVLEGQRPGLALVDGEVYAAFASHCDLHPWYGWIAGVTTSGALHDLWVDETGTDDGGGIWGPGGIDVDGAGNLYFATGNGGVPAPGPGRGVAQPSGLGECVVKLTTSTGHLELGDYFCPSTAVHLDSRDGDLGSGSPLLLPPSFGTSAHRHLVVESGKSGTIYLLDRSNLGGYDDGPGGGDAALQEIASQGANYAHPAAWPGDGGYVYLATVSAAGQQRSGGSVNAYRRQVLDDDVSLHLAGRGARTQFGSGNPIVTSDGTTSGSAVVWEIVRPNASSTIGRLEAFGAVPVPAANGARTGRLPLLYSASIGNSSKFSEPFASSGRIYVATFDGQVRAFGRRRAAPALAAAAVRAPDTVLGGSSEVTANLRATGEVTITGASITVGTPGATGAFATAALGAPVRLSAGESVSLPLTFTPKVVGGQSGALTVTTTHGTVAVGLSGAGIPEGVPIAASPPSVDYGGRPIGSRPARTTVVFQNTSTSALSVQSVAIESGAPAPFSLGTLPDPLPELAPGQTMTVPVRFTPPATSGDSLERFSDHLIVATSAGESSVPLSASSAPPAHLIAVPSAVDLGGVTIGRSRLAHFVVTNVGGFPLHITKSVPPTGGEFSAVTSLPVGTAIRAHASVFVTLRFRPTAAGRAVGVWVVRGSGASGTLRLRARGHGVVPRGRASPDAVGPER